MIIKLYNNISDKEVVSKALTLKHTYNSATLKDGCSVVDPVITIYDTDDDLLTDCNYAYIEELGRFYFINDVVSASNNIVVLSLHCDVLSTYWNTIKNCDVLANSSESWIDNELNRGQYQTSPQKIIEYTRIGNNEEFPSGQYVILVVGGESAL